jgi:hypothetical protein
MCGIMEGIAEGLRFMSCLFVGLIPLAILGVWKLIEIIIWLFNHVRVV